MDYELAKQLKDAGFPQKEPTLTKFKKDGTWASVYEPILEELIDYCDEYFGKLIAPGVFDEIWKKSDEWRAVSKDGEGMGYGKTPKEAVAKLWLEINK